MNKTGLVRITAGEFACTLSVRGGLALCSLRDIKKQKNILSVKRPLFYLTARKVAGEGFITVDSLSGWSKTAYSHVGDDFVFTVSGNEKLPGVTAVLCAHVCPRSRIEWTTRLISTNKEYSLYECDHPMISFDSNKNVEFMSPNGPGELWNSTEECRSRQNYPSYGASMQYMTFWNKVTRRGVYYGLHDPAPAYKKLFFEKNADSPFFALKAVQPLADIDRGCNSQPLFGSCVWQLYDGDWYDAAMLYREFVYEFANWMPAHDENGRKDEPAWFKKENHWWRVRMTDDESFADTVLEANRDLGYNSALHLYDWHQIPFDNDYPHYFPVKPAMMPGVKRLQENGVKVMPYINGRLWDTRDKGMDDWQWSTVAKPNCTKDRNGVPFTETYSSREADGSKVVLSIMCPSTACWQQKVTSIVDKLLNELGVDGVYIDQIAAAQPYICEDRTHSHRPGGGSWWMDSYNILLDHVNSVRPPEKVLSTECTADPFMKNMQAYLTWLWVHNRQVPAFVAVYSGLVTMFGRNYCFMPDDDDEGQRINIAQSLTFGEELGWNDPKLYLQMKHRGFYRECVHTRVKIGSYFYSGRLLRSPAFTDTAKALRTDRCREAYGGVVEHSAAFCEHWQRNTDGEKLLVLVNAAETENEVSFTRGLEDGKYTFAGGCGKTLVIKNGKGSITLPPLSVNYAIHK